MLTRKEFAYYKPSDAAMPKIAEVRDAFSKLLDSLEANCPRSRELSVAITELETCAMWAVKAIVINDRCSESHGPTR